MMIGGYFKIKPSFIQFVAGFSDIDFDTQSPSNYTASTATNWMKA